MSLPNSQKKSQITIIPSIIHLPQSFLIWWTGAKRDELPKHLRKPYAGLGAMAMVSSTLATFGGYSFVLISIGSTAGAIPGALLAGYFMWGMDRSVLGFAVDDSSNRKPGKSNSSSKKDSKKGLWIKLAINVAFSSILTLPLSVYIQRGAVQKHNMNLTTAQIEKVERKIDKQDHKITSLENKKEKIDANWKFGNRADGSINEAYFQDKEQARQEVIEAKAEKKAFANEKAKLREEYEAYERGDLSKVSLSFPEQFYYMMSQARWTDNLLNFSFFTITALMGSGAVLIKTFVFGADSYSKKLQALEDAASNEEKLKNAIHTSAKQIYYSLFNTDVMGAPIKTKLQRLQRDFESETERMATWLYEERTKQMRQQIHQQAVSEDLELNNNDLDLGSNNTSNGLGQHDKGRRKSPQVIQPNSKSNKRTLSEKKSKLGNHSSPKTNNSWQDKSPHKNGNHETSNGKASPKIGKNEDFMTLFGDVDRQISREKNGNSNGKKR